MDTNACYRAELVVLRASAASHRRELLKVREPLNREYGMSASERRRHEHTISIKLETVDSQIDYREQKLRADADEREGGLPIHIDVGRPDLTETEHANAPDATKVYVSGNGYQWAGFVIKNKSDLVRLRDAIANRLVTMGDEGF